MQYDIDLDRSETEFAADEVRINCCFFLFFKPNLLHHFTGQINGRPLICPVKWWSKFGLKNKKKQQLILTSSAANSVSDLSRSMSYCIRYHRDTRDKWPTAS